LRQCKAFEVPDEPEVLIHRLESNGDTPCPSEASIDRPNRIAPSSL
jgi:hypothetical protein